MTCPMSSETPRIFTFFMKTAYTNHTRFVFLVVNRIGQLLERFAAMETDSEEKTTENEDSLG